MNTHFHQWIYFTAIASLPNFIYAQENNSNVQFLDEQNRSRNQTKTRTQDREEETLVIGERWAGDYTYITEDTQKLVETAGAQGDPLAAVFALPGVVYSGGEGSEPAVRGSSPDDNQYIVDFMPASYIFHEFGVSIFSEYILHDFQMYSAGASPEYANVTGAAFDVRLREPENKPFSGVVDLSMLRSGLFIESGLTKNSAFYASYRKSLLHLFVDEDDLSDEDEGIVFQELPEDSDYQFKYIWRPSKANRISFSSNGASDSAAAELTSESDFASSNPDFAGDARLDQNYSGNNLVWQYSGAKGQEFTLGMGILNDESNLNWGGDAYFIHEESERKTVKSRYNFPLSSSFQITAGGEWAELDYFYDLDIPLFICTEFDPDCDSQRRGRVRAQNNFDWYESSYYLTSTWQLGSKFNLELGAQRHENSLSDEVFYNPRTAITYSINDKTTLKFKAGSYNRLPDLDLVIEETGNPNLGSPRSNHYVLGLLREFNDGWSINIEGYYKTLDKLPLALREDEADADLLYVNETEGEAYGVDIMLNKNLTDQLYGWVSLSYAKSERTNTRTNLSSEYFLDTPLIFNWVLNWQATQNLNLGWRWSVRSGQAYTPIIGVQENPYFEDTVLPVYGENYSDRLPTYNRLDFRLKWDHRAFGLESALILDVLNALNNENIEERVLDYDSDLQAGDEAEVKDIVGIGLLPVISYRIVF